MSWDKLRNRRVRGGEGKGKGGGDMIAGSLQLGQPPNEMECLGSEKEVSHSPLHSNCPCIVSGQGNRHFGE